MEINDINLTQTSIIGTNNLISAAVSAVEDTRKSLACDVLYITNTCQQNSKVEFTGRVQTMSSSDRKNFDGPLEAGTRMIRMRLVAHLHNILSDTAEVLN